MQNFPTREAICYLKGGSFVFSANAQTIVSAERIPQLFSPAVEEAAQRLWGLAQRSIE